MAARRKPITIMCPTDRCEICRRTGVKIICDHDYRTGLIRGWICDACNTSLGTFGDTIDGLQRAIDYLKRPPTGETYSQYRREQLRLQMRALRERRRDDPAWREKEVKRGREKYARLYRVS